MKLQQQTILITGGGSGIGLELAKQLLTKQNTVIICGRSAEKLSQAKATLPQLHIFQCDVSLESDRIKLFDWIKVHHPSCNVLINNAAIVHKTNFIEDSTIIEKTRSEIETNLFAPIALTKIFLSVFTKHRESAIVNITTGLVYAPRAVYPIYNATKSALHAFTQVLRHQVKDLAVRVIEVMMPAVDTPWHNGEVPKMAITADVAVGEMIAQIEKGENEIRVARVKVLYVLSRIAPKLAFKLINNVT
jgi:uncharacterized oxidoreductase